MTTAAQARELERLSPLTDLPLPWAQVAQLWLTACGLSITDAMMVPFMATERFKLVMAGERATKSWTGAKYAVACYEAKRVLSPEPQLVWLVGLDYISCMPEYNHMVDLLMDTGELLVEDVHVRDGGNDRCSFVCRADPTNPGSDVVLTVETNTGEKPRKMARVAPDGILFCEVASFSEELFYRGIGRLAQKRGWLWASGSFESSTDWLAQHWNLWKHVKDSASYDIPSWTNGWIYPDGYDDVEIQRLKATMPPNMFSQRIAGRPAPPSGIVYADFNADIHVDDVEYDDNWPIEVWIDPGYAGAYAVLAIQVRPYGIEIIDELYERGKTNGEIIAMVRKRPWGKPENLKYGIIDIGGSQHHAERSAIDAWKAAGVRLKGKKIRIVDGIERVRTLLRGLGTEDSPYLRVAPHCRGLLSEMGVSIPPYPDGGPWLYKTDRDGNPVTEAPEQRNNHACSALAYGAIARYGYVRKPKSKESWIRALVEV